MKMRNAVIITFDDETKAIEGAHKLQDLAFRGDVAMDYSVILRKHENGQIEVLKKSTADGAVTWTGMFVGMLVGLFLGPLGFLISALAGMAIGAGVGHAHEKGEDNFVKKIEKVLTDGKIVIVADCIETSPAFLDEAMQGLCLHIIRGHTEAE